MGRLVRLDKEDESGDNVKTAQKENLRMTFVRTE